MSATPPDDEQDGDQNQDQNQNEDQEQDSGGGQQEDSGPSSRRYALLAEADTVGTADPDAPTVSIDGEQLAAVSSFKVSGEGRQKQYLTQISGGGSGGGDEEDPTTDDGSSESGDTTDDTSGDDTASESGSGSGEDRRTPPLTITITGRLGHSEFEHIADLRDVKEPFSASVDDLSLDKMELADLQRDYSADTPHTYGATIKIREYREKTIRIPSGSPGDGTTGGGSAPGGVGDTTKEWMREGDGGVEEAKGDFETITADGKHTVQLGSGDELSNVLYDVSNGGVHIIASGSDWTIKNVGVKGQQPGGYFAILASVPDANGNALIDNVYLGDGQQTRTSGGGIFAKAQGSGSNGGHQGVITCRRLHIGQMVSNGLYASGPATQGNPGKVDVQNSLFYSNNIANIRLGSRDGRTSYVRNCVTVVDGNAIPPCGQKCTQPGATRSRGLWTWYGTTQVINSDIEGDIETKSGGSHEFQSTNRGDSAERRTPAGVPLTPEAAAGGDA